MKTRGSERDPTIRRLGALAWVAIFLLIALLVAAAAHLASVLAVERASPGELSATTGGEPSPALPDILTPFGQVDPTLVGWVETPPPEAQPGGAPLPVAVWLPITGDDPFTLPTLTPYPSPTPSPTATPPPSPTPVPTREGEASPTPPPWPTRPPATGILPTPAGPVNGDIPPEGLWVGGMLLESGCAPGGMPLDGPLTQRFHSRHIGVDIGVHPGTPVIATHSGQVVYAGWSLLGYGNLVVVKNGRFSTYYGHLAEIHVTTGQMVFAGAILAFSGNTGRSTGPHLHYETRIDDVPVDPLTFAARGHRPC